MKIKSTALMLVLVMILSVLAGCAPKEKKPLSEALPLALTSMEGMTKMPADELEMVADVTADEYDECIYYVASDGLTAREAVVVRAKDAANAKTVSAKLESYLNNRRTETRDYLPDQYQVLLKAKVEVKNNTVALIIGEKCAEETKRLMAGE